MPVPEEKIDLIALAARIFSLTENARFFNG